MRAGGAGIFSWFRSCSSGPRLRAVVRPDPRFSGEKSENEKKAKKMCFSRREKSSPGRPGRGAEFVEPREGRRVSRSPQVARFFTCSTLIFTFGWILLFLPARAGAPLCQTVPCPTDKRRSF